MSKADIDRELASCTLLRLRKVSRRVTQIYDKAVEPLGLTSTQFGILSHLVAHDDLAIGELAAHMVMDPTSLTRLLRPLERDGYLAIVPHDEDRRRKVVSLTATGRAVFRKAVPLWAGAQSELRRQLGDRDHLALQRALGVSLDHLIQA